ncbi:MAG: hypothetical protein ACXAAR_02705, partial [Candidatus Thorarchaeota archaeon]
VEYSERPTILYYLYFQVEGMDPIKIATTRPELLCACGAVFIHPKDERYRGYAGKRQRFLSLILRFRLLRVLQHRWSMVPVH